MLEMTYLNEEATLLFIEKDEADTWNPDYLSRWKSQRHLGPILAGLGEGLGERLLSLGGLQKGLI